MATAFFSSAFFGGEFFSSSAPVPDTPTQTPAGRSSKRNWVIGKRRFYGTADEAAQYAQRKDEAPPVLAPPKVKRPVRVGERIKLDDPVPVEPLPTLDFGLLNDRLMFEQNARAMAEQVAKIHRMQLDQDDEDVLLLIWH